MALKQQNLKPKKDPEFCGHCGTKVSTTGPAPRHGLRRYCGKPECRAAKARALRKRLPTPSRPNAPTSCSGCNAALPARKWRAGDEFGRFCRKAACRGRRDRLRSELGTAELVEQRTEFEKLQRTIQTLVKASAAERITCPRCGLYEALDGYVHLTEPGAPCTGTLDEAVGGDRSLPWPTMLAILFPGRRHYDPEINVD